jgi:hypothetical protein
MRLPVAPGARRFTPVAALRCFREASSPTPEVVRKLAAADGLGLGGTIGSDTGLVLRIWMSMDEEADEGNG